MNSFFEKYWLTLPALTSILIVLAFYPFDFWFLGMIGLVPLFYFINFSDKLPDKKIFSGGFFVGASFSVALSFFTLIQFHWLPETYLFSWAVRFLFLPIAILSGTIAGGAVILYRKLRLGFLIDIFTGAAVWTLAEIIINALFSGYHYGLLAYTVHPIYQLVNFASIGGVFFVSFLVALINAFIVSFLLWPRYLELFPNAYIENEKKYKGTIFDKNKFLKFLLIAKNIVILLGITILVLAVVYFANNKYLRSGDKEKNKAVFALLQNQEKEDAAFGKFINGKFYYPKMENLISVANIKKPDFIIYPFAPFLGYLKDDSKTTISSKMIAGSEKEFSDWVNNNVGQKSTLITWNNSVRENKPYNEIDFWKNKTQTNHYQKRALFPFMDYTPDYAQKIGMYTTPMDVIRGSFDQKPIEAGDLRIANLLCSEINNSLVARLDVKLGANIFLAIGSEAMFVDDVAGNFNIISAQYRAVETNRPIIRSNRLGPSAFIDGNGKVLSKIDFGKDGILFGNIEYQKNPRNTLYSYLGNWGFFSVLFVYLLILFSIKFWGKTNQSN